MHIAKPEGWHVRGWQSTGAAGGRMAAIHPLAVRWTEQDRGSAGASWEESRSCHKPALTCCHWGRRKKRMCFLVTGHNAASKSAAIALPSCDPNPQKVQELRHTPPSSQLSCDPGRSSPVRILAGISKLDPIIKSLQR